jgi:glycosyltransferase involved in cell wall biosynthesis
MRVLHLYHDFHPVRGGIEDYLDELTRAQAASGAWEPVVLCAAAGAHTRIERRAGVTVVRAAALGRWLAPFTPGWPVWLRRLRPDVVHLHLPCPFGEWAVWLARPARLVVSLHNDYVRPAALRVLHGPLHRAVLRRAQAVIVATEDYAGSSPALAGLQARVCIVPYGIDLARYACAPRAEPLGDVLSAGRLCYYKGIEVLLAAAPAVAGSIAVAGDGPWRARLQNQAARLPPGARVRFAGPLDEDTLVAQLHAARVFAFPSTARSEAFGLAQLKAMACGLPVVSSDLPGVRWLNRDGASGLTVPVRDAPALAAALNRVLGDDALRARLAAGARARAAEFDLARMVRATAEVYTHAV